MAALTHNLVPTADGGKLSYYTCGSGPSLLVLHGNFCFALTHRELAEALSPYFTVHIASRRGRGLSTAYPKSVADAPIQAGDGGENLTVGSQSRPRTYSKEFSQQLLTTEVADVNKLVQATGAESIICISSSALIVIHALLTMPTGSPVSQVGKLIIFEPPLLTEDLDTSCDISGIKQFEKDLSSGDVMNAMVTAMRVGQFGPGWIPRGIMRWLSSMMMDHQQKQVEKRRQGGEEDQGVCTMKALGPLTRYDFAIAEAMVGGSQRLAAIGSGREILLLSGSKTPPYLAQAMEVLGGRLPKAKRVVIDGVGHELLCNREMRGCPQRAVTAIRTFLSGDNVQ